MKTAPSVKAKAAFLCAQNFPKITSLQIQNSLENTETKVKRSRNLHRQSSTFSRLLILYLSSGFVLFWIKTSSLDNVAEARFMVASSTIKA